MKGFVDINNLQAGDYKEFEKLFNEWYVPLCNYAFSMLRDMEEARDMVQKTFYKLWDKRSELEIHTSIKSYLYRMVHNDCMNRIKQHKVREEHNAVYAYENSSSENSNYVDSYIINNELQKQIEQAINDLPPRCAEVFRLSRIKQLSYAEIAEELNISSNTVETQIVKALKVLREKLKDYLPLVWLILILNQL